MILEQYDVEGELVADLARLSHDPLGFVRYAYPWGDPDTSLEHEDGPDDWQIEALDHIGRELRAGKKVIRVAVRSGHGVGKSTFAAWVTDWALSTFTDTRMVVTANTESQLRTKTSPEIAKWRSLSITSDWFTSAAFSIASVDPEHKASWRADLIPWSENNTEAFAGLHNLKRRIVVLFDEASAIVDKIWEVAEGAMTDADTEIIWIAMGNPTRNSGRFFQIWNKHRSMWHRITVDSRQSRRTNKDLLNQWVELYGEDSDFVRVRVKGEFPSVGDQQFIPGEFIDWAAAREVVTVDLDPIIVGVDPARFGDDQAVIYVRHGRNARDYPIVKLPRCDHETFAGKVAEVANSVFADAIIVDGGGIGGPIVDTLRSFGLTNVHEVHSQHPANDKLAYFQKDAEMWGGLREALKGWLAIPDDEELKAELTGREYTFRRGAVALEHKDDMKRRGLASPNIADALALTFAVPIQKRKRRAIGGASSGFQSDINDLRP